MTVGEGEGEGDGDGAGAGEDAFDGENEVTWRVLLMVVTGVLIVLSAPDGDAILSVEGELGDSLRADGGPTLIVIVVDR